MTVLLTLAALIGAGLALLRLARLASGRLAIDGPLAWFLGQGWYATAVMAFRFLLGVRLGAAVALAVVLAPPAVLLALRLGRRAAATPTPAPDPAAAPGLAVVPRWRPRPGWLYGPLAAFVVVTALAVVLHALNTPTNTDDGVRVRAYAPVLAFRDAWSPEARAILLMAGPLPTFVPSFAWTLTGTVDHVHTNVVVLADLVALLVLAVGLASVAGRPERGWAVAFAICSMPFFLYHCTTTYSDAPLAILATAGLLLAMEHARRRDPADAVRAMLVLLVATMVKREGQALAGASAAVLLAQVAWSCRGGTLRPLWRTLVAASPLLLVLASAIAALGLADAFPLLGLFASRSDRVAQATLASPEAVAHAPLLFARALFVSSNHGLIFWILPVAIPLLAPQIWRRRLAWPLLAVALLFLESALSSIWLAPSFTLDGTTVHRSLIAAAVAGSAWLAALLTTEDVAPATPGAAATSTAPVEARRPARPR